MISQEELKNFVKTRSWYQTIKFEEDVISKGCEWCGEPLWENAKELIPNTLNNMRVLDLGCNAGLFCIKAALLGAKEIIGIDYPGWRPDWNGEEQRIFVKEFFEQKYNRKFPITYLSGRMEDILDTQDLGKFDYAFAFASLYYANREESVVSKLASIARNVIVRLRDKNRIDRFTSLFRKYNFTEKKVIQEKWWEKLNRKTDDFYLYWYTMAEIPYYRIIDYHNEMLKDGKSLNIRQLMELIGTEIVYNHLEDFKEKIDKKYLTYVKLYDFSNARPGGKKLTDDMKKSYPWEELSESIKEKGIIKPVIAERLIGKNNIYTYRAVEGKHRITAASYIEPYNKDLLVPCLVVERDIEYTEFMRNKVHYKTIQEDTK